MISYKKKRKHSNKAQIIFIYAIGLFMAMSVVVPSYAKVSKKRIAIERRDPTVGQVTSAIEKQTPYRFFYDASLDTSVKADVSRGYVELETLLDVVFKNRGYSYRIGATIISVRSTSAEEKGENIAKPEITIIPLENIFHYTFVGRVLDDRTHQPIEGCVVSILGEQFLDAVSNEEGYFSFKNLAQREYDITIIHNGYDLKTAKLENIGQEGGDSQVFVLKPKAISGVESVKIALPQYRDRASWMDEAVLNHMPTPPTVSNPKFALKTNVLMWATTSLNLGFEVRLSDKVTLDFPVSYNPWKFSDNKLFRHVLVQPEIRYWTRESFNGHFIGTNLVYSLFNIGNITLPFGMFKGLKDYRYEGNLYGVGLSYGYQWILSNKLSLEATAGLGYFYADYDKFLCENCARKIERNYKHYIGLTKLGVSFSYYFR